MKTSVTEIKATSPSTQVKLLTLDLASLKDVRKAAEAIMVWQDVPHIDIVVNNTRIMAVPYSLTEDDVEVQFQNNHLHHSLFIKFIMEKLLAAQSPRIVQISSGTHRVSHVR